MSPGEHNKPRRIREGHGLAAITFDVTHTLIHAPDLGNIYQQVLQRHGINVRASELRREIPLVWKEVSCRADMRFDRFAQDPEGARGWWHRFVVRLCQYLGVEEPSRFTSAELFNRFSQAESWHLYEDVLPTLRDLRSVGLRLGVISNWDDRLPLLLRRLGLTPYFASIVYSAQVGCEKPHPKIFRHCLEALDVPPEQALHVGDSTIEDAEGATAAGMRSLLIDRGAPRGSLRQVLRALVDLPLTAPESIPRSRELKGRQADRS